MKDSTGNYRVPVEFTRQSAAVADGFGEATSRQEKNEQFTVEEWIVVKEANHLAF